MTESDAELSTPPVETNAVLPQSIASDLLKLVGSGSLAGLAFGVADVCRASLAAQGWVGLSIGAAVLGLWLWFGQMLGVVVWMARLLAAAIKRRLPNQFAWHGFLALVAGALALMLARKVFAGSGISRTPVGRAGSWVIPPFVVLSVWVAVRLSARGGWQFRRGTIVCAAAALAVAALLLDAYAPGGYLSLHALLLTVGLGLAFHAVDLMDLPAISRHLGLAASLLTVPSLLVFPSSRAARELMAQPTWAGLRLIDYAQYHVDFDHDGHSPVFGAGDCDDADASAFSGARERPGDGRDSNCDGLDDPKPSALQFEPFRTQSDQRAQQVAERARTFPTVVILVDALRFDRIGKPRFPNLAQLAKESIRFDRMYSTSSTTLTSVPAMMSGSAHPTRARPNIAQSLARAGQSSRFIAPDVITAHFKNLGLADPLPSFSAHESVRTNYAKGWGAGDTVSTSAQLTAAAIESLGSAQPPDLLWLHYYDVHQWKVLEGDWIPADGDVARYDAVLERLDADLRPLLEWRDRVNIVLLADHGEGLGGRGVKHHGSLVFGELTHIPFLVRVPGSEAATVDVPLTSTGMFNLVRALRGLEPDVSADPSPLLLLGATDVGNGPGLAGFDDMQWSLLYGRHRLLYMPRRQLVELYDVDRDPLEQHNRADEDPHLAADLLSRLFDLHNEPRK